MMMMMMVMKSVSPTQHFETCISTKAGELLLIRELYLGVPILTNCSCGRLSKMKMFSGGHSNAPMLHKVMSREGANEGR
ncbi:hypothetical protein F3Y22_tig00110610pilonHSYRG00013 [Hibiscus syriacus]|uniref:Uncharacterized protein n=1 Tax=Hibiscus syriacus TaxID=106335 RepID=A0A6A3A1Z7_HIBSY|nr:hypothetical protein F3Y22_tig00110610pilonHSYRG00013 [Hibiscus syriacus]